jgi:hypothetical protein
MFVYSIIQIFFILISSWLFFNDVSYTKYIITNLILIIPLTSIWFYTPTCPIDIVKCIYTYLLLDLYTFVLHRLLHTPCGMRYIHHVHHSSVELHPLQGWHMHPFEFCTIEYGRLLLFNAVNKPAKLYMLGICLLNFIQNMKNHIPHDTNLHWLHHKYRNVNYSRIIDWFVYSFIPKYITWIIYQIFCCIISSINIKADRTDYTLYSVSVMNGLGHLIRILRVMESDKTNKQILWIYCTKKKVDVISRLTSHISNVRLLVLDYTIESSILDRVTVSTMMNLCLDTVGSINRITKFIETNINTDGIPSKHVYSNDFYSISFLRKIYNIKRVDVITYHPTFRLRNKPLSLLSKCVVWANLYLHTTGVYRHHLMPFDENTTIIPIVNVKSCKPIIVKNVFIYWTLHEPCMKFDNMNIVVCDRNSPITNSEFIANLKWCDVFITSGGYESVLEALSIGKPVLTVSALNNEEQYWSSRIFMQLTRGFVYHTVNLNIISWEQFIYNLSNQVVDSDGIINYMKEENSKFIIC